MELKVLTVGDVVGEPGLERIRKSLRMLRRETGAVFVIVNGENASNVGMTPRQGDTIFDAGADVITMGNHTFPAGRSSPTSRKTATCCALPTCPPSSRAGAGRFTRAAAATSPSSTSSAGWVWTTCRTIPSC